jgi:hypothetical protein
MLVSWTLVTYVYSLRTWGDGMGGGGATQIVEIKKQLGCLSNFSWTMKSYLYSHQYNLKIFLGTYIHYALNRIFIAFIRIWCW